MSGVIPSATGVTAPPLPTDEAPTCPRCGQPVPMPDSWPERTTIALTHCRSCDIMIIVHDVTADR